MLNFSNLISPRGNCAYAQDLVRQGVSVKWQPNPTGFVPTMRIAKKGKTRNRVFPFFGTPTGNRTPVSAVRGRRLDRLTMRACRFYVIIWFFVCKKMRCIRLQTSIILTQRFYICNRLYVNFLKKRPACAGGKENNNPFR